MYSLVLDIQKQNQIECLLYEHNSEDQNIRYIEHKTVSSCFRYSKPEWQP